MKIKDPKAFLNRVADFIEEEKAQFRTGASITLNQLGFFLQNYFVNKKLFGLGRDRIFRFVSKEFPEMKLTRRQVNRILQRFEIVQLTAPKKKTTDVKKIITKKPMNIVEMDLVDFSNLAWKKDKWMMTAVDTHSKFLFAVPLKSKEEAEVTRAFKALLAQIKKQTKMQPKNVLTDNGTEFINKSIKKVYESKGINHLLTKPGEASHAVNIERMNLYVRNKVTQWREQFDDMNWVKYLPTILKNYNKTPSRVTKMSPEQVLADSSNDGANEKVVDNIKKSILPKNNKKEIVPYKVGDMVRIKTLGEQFDKPSNNTSYTKAVYKIKKVYNANAKTVLQPGYTLENDNGRQIDERYYHHDLLVVKPSLVEAETPEKFQVQKIIADKKEKSTLGQYVKYLFIKWQGYPASDNSWEPEAVIASDLPKRVAQYYKAKED
jgi:hypothetical protein